MPRSTNRGLEIRLEKRAGGSREGARGLQGAPEGAPGGVKGSQGIELIAIISK